MKLPRHGPRAAALTTAALVALAGCGGATTTPQVTDHTRAPATDTATTEATPVNVFIRDVGPGPGGVARGLIGRPRFPVAFTVPDGVREQAAELGLRGYLTLDGQGGLLVGELSGLVYATERFTEPAQVHAWLRQHREDLVVSRARTMRVAGRAAVTFRYRDPDGKAMRDIWAVEGGATNKDPAGTESEVTILEFDGRLLWVQANWTRRHAASALPAYRSLLNSLRVGGEAR